MYSYLCVYLLTIRDITGIEFGRLGDCDASIYISLSLVSLSVRRIVPIHIRAHCINL